MPAPDSDLLHHLDAAREVANRAQRRVYQAETATANHDDLVVVLAAIAEELHTANLFSAAATAASTGNMKSGQALYVNALRRIAGS